MRTLALAAFSLSLVAQSALAQSDASPAPPGGAGAPVQAEQVAVESTPVAAAPDVVVQVPEAAAGPALAPGVEPVTAAPAAGPNDAVAVPASSPAQVDPAPAAVTEATSASDAPVVSQRATYTTPRAQPRVRGDAGAPFSLGMGGGVVWNQDKAYGHTKTSGHTPQFDMLLSYDVVQLTKRVVVSLGASLRRGHAEGDVLSITDNTLQAELMARFAGTSWLWPHARASVGAAFTRLKVEELGLGADIEANDRALASSFGGGLTLKTPTRAFESRTGRFASLSFGILVEGGYTLASEGKFSGVSSGGTSDVTRSRVRLGSIDRNAPYLRILAVTRF